ncbi:MAG: nuclease-related domain-containing protein [Kiritimatiellae bacterium]|nr:nuclease-related domain-containing protein [Kiritimatiellia bacterium]
MEMDTQPQIYGTPGERARFSGLLRAALPLGGALLLCGYALGALLPWPALPLVAKCWLVLILATALYLAAVGTQGRVEAFFKGARGEELVAQALTALPGDCAIFHGVDLGAGRLRLWRGRDLDHVVVSSRGVALIETKNWRGEVAVREGRVVVNGRDPSRPPLEQVRREARGLRDWLAQRLPDAPPVRPIVCFTGAAIRAGSIAMEEVTLCNAGELVDALAAEERAALDQVTRERIVQMLSKQV